MKPAAVPKRLAVAAVSRFGLSTPALRVYERVRALGRETPPGAPGDPPLPPAHLRVRIAGTPDARWFLESGRLAVDAIDAALRAASTRLEDMTSILDFGCGVGRVLRLLGALPGELYGTDVDAAAVAWCRRNLEFARFERSSLSPPLPFGPVRFELIYALSVLTHLPVELQDAWVAELSRALRPGGFLLLTTHGDRYLDRLSPAERDTFERGQVVVRRTQAAGTNLCSAFHPRGYVVGTLGAGLELVHESPGGALGNPHQDLYLFRAP
jgi:SAM-dependent methyltransferase